MCDYKKPFEQVAAQDSRNLADIFNKVGWQGAEDEAKHNVQNPGRAITKAAEYAALWYLGSVAGGAAGGAGSAAGEGVAAAGQGAQAATESALLNAGIVPGTAAWTAGGGGSIAGAAAGNAADAALTETPNASNL